MDKLSWDQLLDIPNTRQICAKHTIPLDFVLMDHGVISFTIWMKSPMTLKTAKVNNNHQHPSSTKILLLHPSHPIKSLEAEELFLPSINCQARTNHNNNNKNNNNKSNHCQCLTLFETITINNKNNNRVPREEIISTPIHQDGIPSILTVLVSMLIKNKLPDSQYSAPYLSRSI